MTTVIRGCDLVDGRGTEPRRGVDVVVEGDTVREIIEPGNGDYPSAEERGQEGLRLMRELGDERGASVALNNLGWLAHHRAEYARAAERHRDCLELRRRIGDARSAEFSRTNLGWALACQGRHAEAAEMGRAAGHVLAVDQDAAGGGLDEARDEVQGGRLAAAGRPEQREELALQHRQVEAVHRAEGAVLARATPELDDGAGHLSAGGTPGRGRGSGRPAR